jgi:hypothetical protein
MARIALLDPKNFAPDTGSKFKEGFVRVDQSHYSVVQDKPFSGKPQQPPYTAMVWSVTRLGEDLEPLTDEEGNPLVEKLNFGLGGKCLPMIHPGNGTGPEDDEPDDLGEEVGVEGNTLALISEDFKLNSKSGLGKLSSSLMKIGYTPLHMTRMWAPDFAGVILHMRPELSEEKMMGSDGKEYQISYKVADKFFPAGKTATAAKKSAASEKKSAAGAVNGKAFAGGDEAERLLDPILLKLSESLDGQAVTRKTLSAKVAGELQAGNVETKLHIPILALVKNNTWLEKNGAKYDFRFDAEAGTVTFGEAAA